MGKPLFYYIDVRIKLVYVKNYLTCNQVSRVLSFNVTGLKYIVQCNLHKTVEIRIIIPILLDENNEALCNLLWVP